MTPEHRNPSTGIFRESHGEARNKSGQRSPEYRAWECMKRRCLSVESREYKKWYGSRGITVCKEWADSYQAFLRDVGRRPTNKHSLDRIDNSKGYEPGNVKWSTATEQNRNRRNVRRFEFNGKTQTADEWAAETGIDRTAIWYRIVLASWPIEKALTTPVRHRA